SRKTQAELIERQNELQHALDESTEAIAQLEVEVHTAIQQRDRLKTEMQHERERSASFDKRMLRFKRRWFSSLRVVFESFT
ncbi:MAG: hypothetical protein AAFQ57_06330, partial [Cyanobacteria bacterium J06626_14]